MNWGLSGLLLALLMGLGYLLYRNRKSNQLSYIKQYHFHRGIKHKLQARHPQLTEDQLRQVFTALREYFYVCNKAGKKMVAMPSQVVDDAWHEFILFTRQYKKFCQNALGRFLHHTPAEAMDRPTRAQEGIQRAWRIACARENIDPKLPERLPLLFAIDAMLDIPNGFTYALNCKDRKSPNYGEGFCAGHIGCTSGCVGDCGAIESGADGGFFDGLFDGFGDGGCSSGCGGGCGSGCGGD